MTSFRRVGDTGATQRRGTEYTIQVVQVFAVMENLGVFTSMDPVSLVQYYGHANVWVNQDQHCEVVPVVLKLRSISSVFNCQSKVPCKTYVRL
jgi:hypothetical protein